MTFKSLSTGIMLLLFLVAQLSVAAEEAVEKDNLDFLDNIDYPELQVVPRASERLETEAQYEREGGSWLNQWTFLTMGAGTLAAATMTNSALVSPTSDQQNGVLLAEAVGFTTLGIGIYYSLNQPYNSGFEKVKKARGPGKRQMLLRERLAEEALEKPAKNIGSLSTISTFANLIFDAYLAGQGNSTSRQTAYFAAVLSSLPFLFPSPYVTTWEKQKEYKHKIYAPLPQASLSVDPKTGDLRQHIGFLWNW